MKEKTLRSSKQVEEKPKSNGVLEAKGREFQEGSS